MKFAVRSQQSTVDSLLSAVRSPEASGGNPPLVVSRPSLVIGNTSSFHHSPFYHLSFLHSSSIIRHFTIRPSFISHLTLLTLLAACAAPLSSPGQSATDTPVVAFGGTPHPPSDSGGLPDYLQVSVPTINPNDPLRFTFPTPPSYPTPLDWRPPVLAVPISKRPEDHFWFARPIASNSVNYPLWTYRYGSTNFGAANIHAGIDVDAPLHTPVLAAGPGEVIWAGWGLFYFRPGLEGDPYGIAVAIRHDFGYKNQTLYSLYGHMEALNNLFVGQRVDTGDVLGWVGVTGNTTGPHVHFEVRQNINDYFHTRNPELWIAPYTGWGVLAGQLLDLNGQPITETPITIYDARGRYVSEIYTYGHRVASRDDDWRENFAISDLPAGIYLLQTGVSGADGRPITAEVNVLAGQTNFVVLQQGAGQVNDFPAPSKTPPYPTNTPTDTPTPTHTPSPTSTNTPRPSATSRPTRTPTATRTPRVSPTPALTVTPTIAP